MGAVIMARGQFAGRHIGDEGLLIIRQHSTLDRVARKDSFGHWVIGYNHQHGVKEGDTITPENAHALLLMDLGVIAAAVCEMIKVPLPQNQFDALCSFTHDFGIPALTWFRGVEMVNSGDYTNVPRELSKWHVSDNGILRDPRRTARRHAECQLWMGIYSQFNH